MLRDAKLLKKYYLLSPSSFEKMKEIEATERTFNVFEKAMHSLLYKNSKLNEHDKWMKYNELLNKYLNLRNRLISKYGETEKKTQRKKKQL